jgi:hypothetical protein
VQLPAFPIGRSLALAACACAVALAAGCGRGMIHGLLPANQRPTVSITDAPRTTTGTSSYACEISWAGFDPDGRVSAFRYAIDPPTAAGADTHWVTTNDNRGVFSFRADSVVGAVGHRFHTFVVESIDDRAAHSAPAWVSFDATTLAPTVVITNPSPNALLTLAVPTALRVTWTGDDPDGAGSRLPAYYRWRLFSSSSTPSMDAIRADPDTLRALFAPTFTGWDSLAGSATNLALRDLTPGQSYLFVIVAFDAAGAWSPVFSLYANMLQVRSDVAGVSGPQPTLWNDTFRYEFAFGGLVDDPAFWPSLAFAAGLPIPIHWSAVVNNGTFVQGARWALDLEAIDDETPRSDEQADVHHWSRWSSAQALVLPAIVPPPGVRVGAHFFYLEIVDNVGLLTLVGIRMSIVRPSFSKPLLVIDDTAFRLDRNLATGCTESPLGTWPTAAELDTFLYAVGNVPWQCYPAGTNSSPGVFAGYDFDTLGTHYLPSTAVSLGQMATYRNIIWMVDGPSAVNNDRTWNTNTLPMPLFRAMATSGALNNALLTWMQMGGRLWLMGGGAAYASLRDFDGPRPSNVFANSTGELVAGRFMYSFAHWQSEETTLYSFRAERSPRAVGGWAGAPDYSVLPPLLAEKTTATDPVPPGRAAGLFYQSSYFAEYLSKPNVVLEPRAGMPADSLESTLDTLYTTRSGASGSGWPVMTLYHGPGNPLLVFSGFPIWYFQRSQEIALTDFVLQKVFGMTRRPVPR